MKQVKVGLIGLGFMGSTHFRIYEAMPNAKIVALADVDAKKRAGDVSSVIGNIGNSDNSVPLCMDGIHTYENAFDLINDPEVELVDICCPTPDHAKYIIAALAAGKHVFAEKPLCRNREQEKEISDAVANAKSFINFGMCVRAWPEYRYAWELFQSGKCGKMLTATFRRLSPSIDGNHWENWFMDKERSGGALLDMHLHDTDAICYFFGRPEAVTSVGRAICSKNGGIDHVISLYHYGDGTVVEAEGGWGAPAGTPFEMSFQIICEKCTIRLMSEGFKIYWNDGTVETPEVAATTGWHVELEYFVNCILNNVTPDKYQNYASVSDAFKVVMAEQDSVDCGERVKVQY